MKSISAWNQLQPYGIDPLTGEACGLSYRILCDVSEAGRRLLGKVFGIASFHLAEPWNRGTPLQPSIGSIMLSPEMLVPIAVFALLESGCREAWIVDQSVWGVETLDTDQAVKEIRTLYSLHPTRTLAYRGTAADRNVHVMSGRVE